mgnify:CR=1 FL=1
MSLRISLKDGEKVVINGAVLRSVGRTDLCIDSKAALLRGREIMDPADATTPARRLYFHTMMAYLDREGAVSHQDEIIAHLKQVASLLPTNEAQFACASFARVVAGMNYYRALGECRTLMRLERDALDRAASAPESAEAA